MTTLRTDVWLLASVIVGVAHGIAADMGPASFSDYSQHPMSRLRNSSFKGSNGYQITNVIDNLNNLVWHGDGLYDGGKGVFVRNPFDGYEKDTKKKVVPTTFIVDDIGAPNKVFPRFTGGKLDFGSCVMAYVVGSAVNTILPHWDQVQDPSWGWGVFYPWDSNAADSRCEFHEDGKWYDCPGGYKKWGQAMVKDNTKLGAGGYPQGNPAAGDFGGGAGCHYSSPPYGCNDKSKCTYDIDQINRPGHNLVGNAKCECNYIFNDNWQHWVETLGFIKEAAQGTLPEAAMCWTNNLRDLIRLANALYIKKTLWFKKSYVGPSGYWGWNEIPISREKITNPLNWDAVFIKMPLYICGKGGGGDNPDCLSSKAANLLEGDLTHWAKEGLIVPGSQAIGWRPGSYVTFMREWVDSEHKSNSWFFCQSWTSPNKYWSVNYEPPSNNNPTGACWLDRGNSFTDSVLQQTFEEGVSRGVAKAISHASTENVIV